MYRTESLLEPLQWLYIREVYNQVEGWYILAERRLEDAVYIGRAFLSSVSTIIEYAFVDSIVSRLGSSGWCMVMRFHSVAVCRSAYRNRLSMLVQFSPPATVALWG